MNLVVAAPHAKCQGPERDCDLDAKGIVLSLIKKARAQGINTIGCLANKMRTEVDNNRDGSENSQFRRELDEKLQSDGLFLEIHSHPNVPRFEEKQMTIFNLDRNKNLGVELYRFLNDHRVGIQSGEPVMSIQKKYRGLMLEFNEGMDHDELLNKLVKFVSQKKPAPMFGGRILLESLKLCKWIVIILVLLFIVVKWCELCNDMEKKMYESRV